MRIKEDFSFERSYDIKLMNELGAEKRFYFPNGQESGGNDGLIIRVSPLYHESWTGIFAFGNMGPKGISTICSMPDKNKLCVVSRGAGYIVSSNNPTKWEEVSAIPIIDIKRVVTKELILFADYTKIVSYDSNGLRWQSGRLAYDSLSIVSVDDQVLKGKYWDIRTETEKIFEVNLADGSAIGGVEEF